MRMLTFALLLASATSVPAYAQFGARENRDAARDGSSQQVDEARAARYERRAEAREERRQEQPRGTSEAVRQNRWNGGWRGDQGARPQTPPPAQRAENNSGQWSGNRHWQRRNDVLTTNPAPVPAQPRREGGNNGERRDGDRWTRGERHDGDRGEGRRFDRDGRRDRDWSRDQGRWDGRDNDRWEHGNDRDRHWNDGNRHRDWNRSWRNDRRYDWQRYRNQYRHHYRAPRYYNPYGYDYRYRRFSIGISIGPLFYSSRYWLSDPWEYRLPPAPYGCRWVRYYDDVLLVDVRSGFVIDVIYDFFW